MTAHPSPAQPAPESPPPGEEATWDGLALDAAQRILAKQATTPTPDLNLVILASGLKFAVGAIQVLQRRCYKLETDLADLRQSQEGQP